MEESRTLLRTKRVQIAGVFLAACLATATIVLSFLPVAQKNALHTNGRFHYAAHILLFGCIAWLSLWHVKTPRKRLWLLIALLFLGLTIEIAQHVVTQGPFEWIDVLADSVAISVAAWLSHLAQSKR